MTNKRTYKFIRKTKETDINIFIDLDWTWKSEISTWLLFFDHMLEQISKHSWIDMKIKAKWDLDVDEHHTIEDTGLALWEAIFHALWEKKWIERYWFLLPMDESLAQIAIDLCWRPSLVFNCKFNREFVWDFPTEMVKHFFKSFSDNLKCTINIKVEWENEHHKIEAIFKALWRCLKQAIKRDGNPNETPSSKWVL